jgi:hypothetical protein
MADGATDGYVSWYQSKLWQLLPAIYRTMDAPAGGGTGPLQELMNRIGAQTATLRRSIDRLWENQSIETCDDWVIPYVGDLVATRLVSCLDARAQRIDVAKTIYYRRRAGTLGLLEELVSDIAGRDARAVEFFRRLGRTRHQFDPPIGNAFAVDVPSWAQSTTYAPGQVVANLGNAYVCVGGGISSKTGNGPVGTGASISDGGVIWSFYNPAGAAVPAVIEGLAGLSSRTPAGGFADLRNNYAAAGSATAFDEFAHIADLRAGAQSFGWYNISHLGMFVWWLHSYQIQGATPVSNGKAAPCFTFDPSGRQIALFSPQTRNSASFGDDWVSPNEWNLPGAARDVLWDQYPDQLYPAAFSVAAAGTVQLDTGLNIHPEIGLFSFAGAPPAGPFTSTYYFALMSTVGAGGFALPSTPTLPVTVRNVQGGGNGISNAFAAVAGDVTLLVQDSLTYGAPAGALAVGNHTVALTAAGGQRPLIRWTVAGSTWTISGNGGTLIIQGVWLQGADVVLTGSFASVTMQFVTLDPGSSDPAGKLIGTAIDGMALKPTTLWVEASITAMTLHNCITGPIRTRNNGAIEQMNVSDSIIQAIPTGGATKDYALQTQIGDVSLARCTVLGPSAVHRLDASESILDDVTVTEDSQHGCVRFCAIAAGSVVHAPYLSVTVPPVSEIFVSRRFGEANYARLLRLADAAIFGGAQNGAEMGAFQSEGVTLLKQGLVLKFEEYAPLGVFPVWIEAD